MVSCCSETEETKRSCYTGHHPCRFLCCSVSCFTRRTAVRPSTSSSATRPSSTPSPALRWWSNWPLSYPELCLTVRASGAPCSVFSSRWQRNNKIGDHNNRDSSWGQPRFWFGTTDVPTPRPIDECSSPTPQRISKGWSTSNSRPLARLSPRFLDHDHHHHTVFCFLFKSQSAVTPAMYGSVFSLEMITLERYVKVVHPVRHRTYFRRWILPFRIRQHSVFESKWSLKLT